MQNLTKKTTVQRVYRIKSPVKLCVFLTLIMLLIFTIFASIFIKSKAMEPVSLIEVEVKSGDTLWSIAKQSLPKDRDIRDYIMEIESLNNLEDSCLVAGQSLIVPVYDEYS